MIISQQVVEDCDHAIVVETLQSLRESEPALLVSVLDAIGNLSLPAHLLGGITSDALSLLESAEPNTLPVLVRNGKRGYVYMYVGGGCCAVTIKYWEYQTHLLC